MRRVRAGVAPSDRAAMEASLEERLIVLPEVAAAATVLLFYSFGSEVGTSGIMTRLRDAGKRLLLPFLEGVGLEAADVGPRDSLIDTGYGPKEPAQRHPVDPKEVDVVVTPGLAFDRSGRRLGYGGGFYDRYLARLRPEAVRVGVAFALQVGGDVPATSDDERVDIVVTDEETIRCETPDAGDS